MNAMPKMRRLALAGALMALSAGAQAALTASVTVTVRIQRLSVSIAQSSFDFGALQLNQSAISTALNLTNDGNVNERFALKGSISGGWSLGSSNPADTTVLYALIVDQGAGAPTAGTFTVGTDTISTVDKTIPQSAADSSPFCDSTVKCNNVPASGQRDLYLMLLTPQSDSSNGAQQTLYLTVTAVLQ